MNNKDDPTFTIKGGLTTLTYNDMELALALARQKVKLQEGKTYKIKMIIEEVNDDRS